MGRDKPPPKSAGGGGKKNLGGKATTSQQAAPKKGGEPAAQQASAEPPQPQWAPWVPGVLWIEENVWDKRIPKDVLQKYRPHSTATSGGRAKLARPGRIMDPAHPAFGQFGLFAAKRLEPNTHVLDYRGLVTLEQHESKTSDYTLTFVDDGNVVLTLDAEKCGNEGRFVNDFRGTGKKANVKFQERVDERGCTHMGIYVGGSPIAKGEEARVGLLLSYGKGYWLARLGYKEDPAAEEQAAASAASGECEEREGDAAPAAGMEAGLAGRGQGVAGDCACGEQAQETAGEEDGGGGPQSSSTGASAEPAAGGEQNQRQGSAPPAAGARGQRDGGGKPRGGEEEGGEDGSGREP